MRPAPLIVYELALSKVMLPSVTLLAMATVAAAVIEPRNSAGELTLFGTPASLQLPDIVQLPLPVAVQSRNCGPHPIYGVLPPLMITSRSVNRLVPRMPSSGPLG